VPEPTHHVSAHTENLHSSKFLHIYVNAARGITAMDLSGTSDAYVVLRFGERIHKTRVVKQTCEPEWQQRFQFEVSADEVQSGDLKVSVWDQDHLKADDLIGSFSVPLSSISRSDFPPSRSVKEPDSDVCGSLIVTPCSSFSVRKLVRAQRI
jgi:Ca2+-dependent lipid-binding protein